jgi:heme/copper-type cytochrome/quinol oxidase subunit 3
MLFFLGAEAMLFAGLVSAFRILRAGAAWPPPGVSRPVEATLLASGFLLASGATMARALGAARRGRAESFRRWLGATLALGSAFVALQGVEWARWAGVGLPDAATLYGAAFRTAIGTHGLHVLGALLALFALWRRPPERTASPEGSPRVEACALLWWFVVGVWPVLYGSLVLF